ELTSDRPTEIYFRLNLRQDQDNKQLLQSLSPDAEARGVTFDLAYADLTP
ncbi:MAG: hypothetical protein GTO37_14100, partial [Planctomycetales bacterium]|nr:hypothetical protein [Planctomycetales bacterium]